MIFVDIYVVLSNLLMVQGTSS